jgi:hypothetical protein
MKIKKINLSSECSDIKLFINDIKKLWLKRLLLHIKITGTVTKNTPIVNFVVQQTKSVSIYNKIIKFFSSTD